MTETKKEKPTHTLYKCVGEGPATQWTKVGVGFPHKDGLGLLLKFDGIPTEGRIALRKNRPAKPAPTPATQGQLPIHLPVPRPVV